jgi:hypothetical protein
MYQFNADDCFNIPTIKRCSLMGQLEWLVQLVVVGMYYVQYTIWRCATKLLYRFNEHTPTAVSIQCYCNDRPRHDIVQDCMDIFFCAINKLKKYIFDSRKLTTITLLMMGNVVQKLNSYILCYFIKFFDNVRGSSNYGRSAFGWKTS